MTQAPVARRLHPTLTRRGDRYGLLLLLLVFSYVISAFAATKYAGLIQTPLFVVALLLALRTSRVKKRTARIIVTGMLIGTFSAVAFALGHATDIGLGIANVWTGLVLFTTVVVIIRRILSRPVVSLPSIFGAVSAYMIIGLMFASFYAAIERLGSAPFFAHGAPGDTRTFQYFSFTTLTTLGYGDFTAATNGGRAVAVMEALSGQVFLATLVARLVASYRTPPRNGSTASANTGPADTGPADTGPADTGPADTGPSIGGREPAAGPAQAQHRAGNPRRGPVTRPAAGRRAPVKWRNAHRRET